MAINGPPAVQWTLGFAATTFAAPLTVAAGMQAFPYALTNPGAVYDFIGSMPAATPPSVSGWGLFGSIVGSFIPGNE